MASRKEQKEAARERRLAEERVRADKARRERRLRMLGGIAVGTIAVIAAVFAISSGGGNNSAPKPNTAQAKNAAATVTKLLNGIPQQGNTLGNPNAKVTLTEYGDLVCPVCKDFAVGTQSQLIASDVRSGKVKIVWKALETASQTANHSMFVPSQAAALAAGQQKLGWDYIELFYHEQGDETASYVTNSYLDGLAQQVPGLNYSKWSSDRQSPTLAGQVSSDRLSAANAGFNSTPTLVLQGPKGQAQPIVGNPTSYAQLESAINSVS